MNLTSTNSTTSGGKPPFRTANVTNLDSLLSDERVENGPATKVYEDYILLRSRPYHIPCLGRGEISKMTPEFEQLKNDPDLAAEPGPAGTLIFQDGSSYCIVGPAFVSVEESDCYAFGETREQAFANYQARLRGLNVRQ